MDPAVSRAKFDRAVAEVKTTAAPFVEAHGWEVLSTDYPVFEVVFTHPASQRRVGFRFSFDNWNQTAPSLELFDPDQDGRPPLPWEKWPRKGWAAGATHPGTRRPFLCLPGIREYHTHSSHKNDHWEPLAGRDSYSMLNLIHRVQKRFESTDDSENVARRA